MIICRTPFRISFFGGGTDYPIWYEQNGGAVLSTTIDKYCYLTCRYLPPFFEHKHRVVYSKIESVKEIEHIRHPSVRAILEHMNLKKGLEIHHDGDLPARAGLGSSSSFTVGLLHALYALQSVMPSKFQLAKEAIHLEREVLREHVGSQDQVAAAYGGFNKISFRKDGHFEVKPIILPAARLTELQDHLILYFTGFSRSASKIAKKQIRQTPKRERELSLMHGLVDEAVAVLASKRNIREFGKLLDETWELKKSLTDKISNPLVDEIYAAAKEAGAIGGKLLGAGGGGFMLFFVKPSQRARVKKRLKKLLEVKFKFEHAGSQIIFHRETGVS
ncbi:kinase [Candidatus Margulisiibacteriota bacterium]